MNNGSLMVIVIFVADGHIVIKIVLLIDAELTV